LHRSAGNVLRSVRPGRTRINGRFKGGHAGGASCHCPSMERGGDVLIAVRGALGEGDGDVAAPSVSGEAMSSSP
jgi:hypothetical protein